MRSPLLLLAAALTLTTLWSCERTFVSCEETLSCEAGSTGSGGDSPTGGASPSGGAKSGGAPGVGGNLGGGGASESGGTSPGGSPGTGGTIQTCEGQCGGSAPYCDPETFACYECETSEDCGGDPTKPVCGESRSCEGCTDGAQCDAQGLLPVCLVETGECVSCADENDCVDEANGNKKCVCDSLTHECDWGAEYQSKGLCEECRYDSECKAGSTCIAEQVIPSDETSITGKKVCAQLKVAGVACGPNTRPFARYLKTTSVSGAEVEVCVHKTASCEAYLHYGTQQGSCQGTDVSAEASTDCGPFGLCRNPGTPDAEYACTYPCTTDADTDCNPSVNCELSGLFCAP